VANLSSLRLRLSGALVVSAAVVALAAPAANADLGIGGLLGGGSCPSSGSQVFAAWGDPNSYYLASNGGLESGSTGWSLGGGASVVYGNEPFLASGTHSLSLPSGSSATSPRVCLGPNDLFIRMFGSDAGGTDSGLHVRVLWYGLLNQLLGSTDFATFGPGSGWAPTAQLDSGGGFDLLLPLVGSTSARVQLTPIGAGSNWRVDDVYIDPWLSN
jgi:hypothetical protein